MVSVASILLVFATIVMTQIKHNLAEEKSFLELIQLSILRFFPSKTTTLKPIPKIQIYNDNTVHRFVHTGPPINRHCENWHKFNLYFNVSTTVSKNETLKSAELMLHDAIESDGLLNQNVHILIYDILKPGDKVKQEEVVKLLIDSEKVNLLKVNGSIFNVQAAVVRWIQNPEANHGLFVHILDYQNNTLDSLNPKLQFRQRFGKKDRKQPELVIYTSRKVKPMLATNRQNLSKPEENSYNRCKLHKAYVKFTDLGWDDWILSPRGFDLNYCKGDCSYPIIGNANTILNRVNPDFVPKVCCVPTSFLSQTLIYSDYNNTIVIRRFPNIRIASCGCV